MNEGEQEIEIELPPEVPETAVVVEEDKPQVAAPVVEKPEIAPEEGIEELKTKLQAAEFAKTHAEEQARNAASQVVAARNEVQDSHLATVSGAIGQVEQNLDTLEATLANAYAAGDFQTVAKVQRDIARNEAQLMRLQEGKTALEQQPKQQITPPPVDPVEAVASQLSPRSAQWVRNHPDYARSASGIAEIQGADALARKHGFAPDTDAYFDKVEELLGIKQPVIQAEPERRAAPAAAPVSRGGNGNGSGPIRVTLSADEKEMADNMGMSYQDWAKQKLALKAEGRLN